MDQPIYMGDGLVDRCHLFWLLAGPDLRASLLPLALLAANDRNCMHFTRPPYYVETLVKLTDKLEPDCLTAASDQEHNVFLALPRAPISGQAIIS